MFVLLSYYVTLNGFPHEFLSMTNADDLQREKILDRREEKFLFQDYYCEGRDVKAFGLNM
jgi:hypothetical protein